MGPFGRRYESLNKVYSRWNENKERGMTNGTEMPEKELPPMGCK